MYILLRNQNCKLFYLTQIHLEHRWIRVLYTLMYSASDILGYWYSKNIDVATEFPCLFLICLTWMVSGCKFQIALHFLFLGYMQEIEKKQSQTHTTSVL